jgi:DNA/RNA endonuclease YhcR with UshA esterase domain
MRARRAKVRTEKIRQNQRFVAKLAKSTNEEGETTTTTTTIPTKSRRVAKPKLLGLHRTLPLGPSKKSIQRKEREARALERVREEVAAMREANVSTSEKTEQNDATGDIKMAPTRSRRRKSISGSDATSSMQDE